MKVKYNGELPALLPTLGKLVNPEDIIDVPDDFNNSEFTVIEEDKPLKPKKQDEVK